jgi:hypothetical protein
MANSPLAAVSVPREGRTVKQAQGKHVRALLKQPFTKHKNLRPPQTVLS